MVAFAVNVAEVATPEALVVAVLMLPANVPLAPLPGAAKVTTTPATGLLPASFTVAISGGAEADSFAALSRVAPVCALLAAAPALFVSAKVAVSAPAVA